MKSCLICHRKEKGKTQHLDCDFICSTCMQKLCMATPIEIMAMYQNARDLGLDEKAELLKPFIKE